MRDKIEKAYDTALGSPELSKSSVEGRMLEVEKSTLDMAGAARLDQLRAQMHPELSGTQARAIDNAAGGAAGAADSAAAAPAEQPQQQS